MRKSGRKLSIWGSVAIGVFILSFQNCGPAKLTAKGGGGLDMASMAEVGSHVDLNTLAGSANEDSSNVFFPLSATGNEYHYSQGSPVIENIVLKKNDFSKVLWIHGPSSTVVAVGETWNETAFLPNMLGTYYVFGIRDGVAFLITTFQLTSKGTSTLNVNSAGAVEIRNTLANLDFVNESILVQVSAPDVDLNSIQFITPSGSMTGQKAILVTKALADSVNVQVILTDRTGQTFTQVVNLPVDNLVPTASTTTTMPAATDPNWVRCAIDSGSCAFTGIRNVRYGANGTFVTKTAVNGPIVCTAASFGIDPTPKVAKACDYSAAEVPAAPGLSLSATSLSFGSVAIGSSSVIVPLTITNTGTAPLVFLRAFTFSAGFSGTGNCLISTPLSPGASCILNLKFSPNTTGANAGSLMIYTNYSSSTMSVQLSGAGI